MGHPSYPRRPPSQATTLAPPRQARKRRPGGLPLHQPTHDQRRLRASPPRNQGSMQTDEHTFLPAVHYQPALQPRHPAMLLPRSPSRGRVYRSDTAAGARATRRAPCKRLMPNKRPWPPPPPPSPGCLVRLLFAYTNSMVPTAPARLAPCENASDVFPRCARLAQTPGRAAP